MEVVSIITREAVPLVLIDYKRMSRKLCFNNFGFGLENWI